jgi:hypothetical protein
LYRRIQDNAFLSLFQEEYLLNSLSIRRFASSKVMNSMRLLDHQQKLPFLRSAAQTMFAHVSIENLDHEEANLRC